MATWQFRFSLVPHRKVEQLDAELFEFGPIAWLEDEAIRDQEWWAEEQPLPGYEAELDRLLQRSRSWSAEIAQWGELDGDCVEVVRDGDRVVEITARFDLRAPNESLVAGILALAENLYCDVLTADGSIARPDDTFVLLRNSPALRFVDDPQRFLQRVARGDYRDG